MELTELTIKPSPLLIGYDKELTKLTNFVNNGNPCLIFGDYGVGKTSALLYLYKKFRDKFNVIYISGDFIISLDHFKREIKKKLNLIDRILGKEFPNNAIVLLDEADKVPDEVIYYLKQSYDLGKIHTFVLAAVNPEVFPESILHRIGDRKVKLEGIKEEFVLEFFKERVSERILDVVDEKVLFRIWEHVNGNPRKMLELLEKVLTIKKERNLNFVKLEDVEDLFKENVKVKKEIRLSPLQKKILSILEEGPKTLKEIAEILNISIYSAGARISELKRLGLIEEIEGRPKRYKIKSNLRI